MEQDLALSRMMIEIASKRTPLLLLSTLLGLHPGHPDADVEIPCGIGHLALRTQRG